MKTSVLPLAHCPRIKMMGVAHHLGGTEGRYVFEDSWTVHLYTYRGSLEVDRVLFPITPGSCSVLPPNTRQVYRFGDARCRHVFAHFRPSSDARISARLPWMQDLGMRFQSCYRALEMAVGFRATNLRRSEARLYDLLFTLAEIADSAAGTYRHPVVRELLEWIDLHLAERFTVARICREFDLSHNHLNTLFKRELSCTIGAYIHDRRAHWATEMLTGTGLPIKVIAAELGYTDLAQFSKLIRRHTGRSPRQLRARPGRPAASELPPQGDGVHLARHHLPWPAPDPNAGKSPDEFAQ